MKTKTLALVLLAVALGVMLGLHAQKTRQQKQAAREYKAAFDALILGEADAESAEGRSPLPSASLPRRAKEAALADRMERTADRYAVLARSMNALTPPPSQARRHAVLVDLYQSAVPLYRQWAAALRAGDTKSADRDSERVQQAVAQHTARLKALGVRFPAWMQDVLKSQD